MGHCLFSWKVTPNKMQGHFWHLFLTQLFMLFHMVASVLLSMVAFSTIFLLVKILQQPIRIFEISGYWSCHGEENACYHVKEHKKLGQKLVSKVTLHFVWGHLSKKQTVMGELWEKSGLVRVKMTTNCKDWPKFWVRLKKSTELASKFAWVRSKIGSELGPKKRKNNPYYKMKKREHD